MVSKLAIPTWSLMKFRPPWIGRKPKRPSRHSAPALQRDLPAPAGRQIYPEIQRDTNELPQVASLSRLTLGFVHALLGGGGRGEACLDDYWRRQCFA